jgi:hypothetical protein
MVWAKSKLMIQDDLLRPKTKVSLTFRVPYAERFYKEVPLILLNAFRASEHEIEEKTMAWDTSDNGKFAGEWELYKEIDKYSFYAIRVKLSGQKGDKGTAKLMLEGWLRTEYPQDTVWQRSLLYEFMRMFWHTSFYAPKHLKYLSEGRRLMGLLIEDLKRLSHALENKR